MSNKDLAKFSREKVSVAALPDCIPGMRVLGLPALRPKSCCTLPEVLLHRDPSIRDPSSSNPKLELVRGLSLLLSGAANKDLRASLSVGKKASSGLIMSLTAAQERVPGWSHSQSCS